MEDNLPKPLHYIAEESQTFWKWWFHPKNRYSIIRIPLGIFLFLSTIAAIFEDFKSLLTALHHNPVFTGILLYLFNAILLPVFFSGTILRGGLFYLPYYVFEEERKGWKTLLKYIGILIGVFLILLLIGFFVLTEIYK